MKQRYGLILLAALLSAAAIGCGDDDNGAAPTPQATATATVKPTATASPTATVPPIVAELAATGIGRHLGIQPNAMNRNGQWEEYTYDKTAEMAICRGGTTYQVNLRRGSSNHVLIYLEGGGACWNYATCWQSPLAKLVAGPAVGGGILDNTNADNPFKDWNIVYASYCDGSVFAGDNIVDYRDKHTYHHGLQNVSAAVTLAQREFPNVDRLVVAGSSAGGFGTYTGYAVTRVAFPTTPLLVFDDSGPGLQNPADTQTIAERNTNWHFSSSVPPTCTECSTQLTYLTDWAVQRDPGLRVAYFDYQEDGVLTFFLKLDADMFGSLLRTVTNDVQGRYPDRIKRFFPRGATHTALVSDNFYTEELNGITVREWTADFLSNGPKWQDLIAP